jgi:hypothetical protein
MFIIDDTCVASLDWHGESTGKYQYPLASCMLTIRSGRTKCQYENLNIQQISIGNVGRWSRQYVWTLPTEILGLEQKWDG